jgi:hypothetical protein
VAPVAVAPTAAPAAHASSRPKKRRRRSAGAPIDYVALNKVGLHFFWLLNLSHFYCCSHLLLFVIYSPFAHHYVALHKQLEAEKAKKAAAGAAAP